MSPRTTLLALCVLLAAAAAPGRALAQQDRWDKTNDWKPLLPPVIPPLLPPNSAITPGSALGSSQSPYSSTPLYDPTRDQATPGLRLTIPSR